MVDLKYRALVQTLKTNILSGKYGNGNPFPSVRALIKRYGLSNTTVLHAMDELVRQGLISRKRGSGTFVSSSGFSRKIGLIVPGVACTDFFQPIVSEINQLARKNDYTLLIAEVFSMDRAERIHQVRELAAEFIRKRVAGVIYEPLAEPNGAEANEHILRVFNRARIPVVLIDCDIVPFPQRSDYDVVGVNDVEAGAKIANHLVSAGARKIHFLVSKLCPTTFENRLYGAEAELIRAGKFKKGNVLYAEPDDVVALKRHVKKCGRPDAFVCSNDAAAAVFKQTLEKAGLSVPKDVLLTGFADMPVASLMTPSLTTIRQGRDQMGGAAFRRLLERIANPEIQANEILFPAPLVIRDSTTKKCKKRANYNVKMKRLCVVLAVMMSCAAVAQDETNLAAFREARFGMFIHWGLYSQLGGRHKGRQMPEKIGEWIQSSFRIPNTEYSRLARTFNPTNFDADAWAKAAKDAGMEYVVLTTKHHEGFSMFATKASAYNIVGATPFGRDVFGELAVACRRQGLKVGLYYSQNLDWHERDGGDPRNVKGMHPNGNMDWGNTWDWPDCSKKDLNRYLKSKVYPQLKELLTNYGDIFLVWFDTSFGMTPEQSLELREYVRSLSPKTIVNSRIGNGCGDFGSMGDNELVTNRCDFVSESAITLNDTWGFRYDDHNWKSAYTVATFLANNLSHDANIILNVGPRPDGRFPDATSDVLSDLGEWQRRTGFKIKGAGPGPFRGTLPWGWCLSVDGNVLQLVIRREWKGEIVLKGLKNDVVSSTARWRKDGENIVVTPSCDPDLMPRVVRIELDDVPKM